MTRTVLTALAIVALAPAAAQGAAVVMPVPADPAAGFSLPVLMDGTDHVLSSVDGLSLAPTNPFGENAVAFASTDRGKRHTGVARTAAIQGKNDAVEQEPLPEPATWLMMILGFFGLSFAVRRRSSPTGSRVRFS